MVTDQVSTESKVLHCRGSAQGYLAVDESSMAFFYSSMIRIFCRSWSDKKWQCQGLFPFLPPNSEKESRVSLVSDTSLGIPEKVLLIYSWRKRINSHRDVFLGTGGCGRIGLMTRGSILERTREATLIHTLNCAFLWLYRVSKTALTTQMDSKMTRGKW